MATFTEEEEVSAVYENTNGVPLCNGKNLHMDVSKIITTEYPLKR